MVLAELLRNSSIPTEVFFGGCGRPVCGWRRGAPSRGRGHDCTRSLSETTRIASRYSGGLGRCLGLRMWATRRPRTASGAYALSAPGKEESALPRTSNSALLNSNGYVRVVAGSHNGHAPPVEAEAGWFDFSPYRTSTTGASSAVETTSRNFLR